VASSSFTDGRTSFATMLNWSAKMRAATYTHTTSAVSGGGSSHGSVLPEAEGCRTTAGMERAEYGPFMAPELLEGLFEALAKKGGWRAPVLPDVHCSERSARI
jgi:hypothetical protein